MRVPSGDHDGCSTAAAPETDTEPRPAMSRTVSVPPFVEAIRSPFGEGTAQSPKTAGVSGRESLPSAYVETVSDVWKSLLRTRCSSRYRPNGATVTVTAALR